MLKIMLQNLGLVGEEKQRLVASKKEVCDVNNGRIRFETHLQESSKIWQNICLKLSVFVCVQWRIRHDARPSSAQP